MGIMMWAECRVVHGTEEMRSLLSVSSLETKTPLMSLLPLGTHYSIDLTEAVVEMVLLKDMPY